MNGTGPYRLVEWRRGDSIRMAVSTAYWSRPPDVSDVRFRLSRPPAAAVHDLLDGSSQFAQCTSRDLVKQLEARSDIQVSRRTGFFVKFLGFDMAREKTPYVPGPKNPFLSRAVREAISLAVDRQSLTGRLSSFGLPASQFVPPFIFGYNPSLPELRYDPELARQRLREAGFPDGFDVKLHTRTILSETAVRLREMLGKVGIRVGVEVLPDADYFRLVDSGAVSMFLSRWGCASGDMSDILDVGFHTFDPARRFGPSNAGRFSDPELDNRIEESAEILDPALRRPVLQDLARRIMGELVWVPLYFDEDVYGLRKPYTWQPRADSYILAQEIARGG